MRLSPPDNVAVALRHLKAGETVMLEDVALKVSRNIAVGHKLAARAIAKGEIILKYSCPIGTASAGSGARMGATLALALIASTLAMNYGFEARPLALWLINAGYMVVGMTIMGAIIGHWRKKA